MNGNVNQKTLESEPTEEGIRQSPPVGPIPDNAKNESDKPSPEDEDADLKSLRIGCLSVYFIIIALYLGWILLIGGNQTRAELDLLLARGVPALSGPVGSREIRSIPTARTKDLNERTSETTWPRANASRWNGWRHGDIRAIALSHVFSVFAEIVQLTDNNQ